MGLLSHLIVIFFSLLVCECFVCMFMYVPCACSTHGGQEKALDVLKLELQMFTSYHMGVGNKSRFSGRAAGAHNC